MKRLFRIAASLAEDAIGGAWRTIRHRFGWHPEVEIIPYLGCGNPSLLTLRGRVQARKNIPKPSADDNAVQNCRRMLARYWTDEFPGASLTASVRGRSADIRTDREGYFAATFHAPADDPFPDGPNTILLRLTHTGRRPLEVTATATALVPHPCARLAIVSDIDDTIIHTAATSLLGMIRVVMLNNALTRVAFPGVADFYRQLVQPHPDHAPNPIFYVTSSPWNIYDVLRDIFRINGIPEGPIFMKDYGFDKDKFLKSSHGSHKSARIRELLELLPDLPFLLIGDSGQHDPEIYRDAARSYPHRIRAIYIREALPDPARHAEVLAIGRELAAAGIPLVLFRDTAAAALHASAAGFIPPDAGPRAAARDPV